MQSESKTGIALLLCLAGVMYALAATHAAALWFSWYWTYPWFDVLTHFWGGACVGIGAIWLSKHADYAPWPLAGRTPLMVVLLSITLVGAVWELYEWAVQTAFLLPAPPNYWPDTLLDLCMDILGALFGWVLWRLVARRRERGEAGEYSQEP